MNSFSDLNQQLGGRGGGGEQREEHEGGKKKMGMFLI